MTSLVDSPIQTATQANETANMPLMQTTPAVLSDAVEEKSLFRKVKRAARALTPDAPSAPKAPKTPAKKSAAAARPSAPKKLSTPDAPSASAAAKKVNRATPDVPNKPDAPKAVNAPDKPRSGASGVSKALGGEGGVTGEIRTINGRTWNTDHHPRDASGRFIETGGSARVWGRQETGKVVRTLPDGKVEVEFSDGHRESHASQRLQMIKRPNGDEPTKRVDAVQDEDERRIKDPTRGNGVDADDLGDRDADGVPDYRDAEPDDPNVRASIPNAKPRSMPRASRAPEGEEKRQIPAGEVHRRGRDVYTRHDVAKPNGTLEVGERIDLGTVERDPERTGKFRATTTDGKVILGGTSADTAAQELRRHANGEDVKEWTPNKRRASAAKKVEAASKPEVATPEKISQAQGDALLALDRYNQAKPDIYVDADKLDAPVNGSALVSLSRAGLIERPDSINQNHGYESPSYRLTAKGKKRAAEVAADRAAAGASDKPAARNAKTHAKVAFKRDDEAQRARTSYESFSPEDQFKIDEAVRENIDDFLADPEDAYRKHLSKAGIALGDDTATSRSVNDVIDAARHRIMEDPKLSSHDRRTRLTKSSRHDQASGAVNAASAALEDGNYEEARRRIGEARDFDPDYRRNHREESSLDGMLAHINKTERDSAAERSRITKEDNDEHSRRTGAEGPGVLGDVPAEQGRGDQRPADVLPESRGGSRSAGEGRVGRGNDLDAPEQTDAPAARRTPGNGEDDRAELGNGRPGVPDAGAGNRAEQGSQPRPVGRVGGRGRVAPAEKANAGERFTPRSQGDLAPSGESQKLAANMSALRTLREVQSGDRAATPAEQKILARWAGWGSLPGVFDENNEKFAAQRAELKELLTPEQYDAARRNTLNAHYTDVDLVDAMWDTMKDLGFTGGDVLEPGSGSGNFIGRAPKGVNMTGVELDPITAGISRLLYPDAEIHNESFGRSTFNEGVFDAVVGNVPFGNFGVIDPRFNPRGKTSIHNHFINKSLASTKPGGVASIITSSHTLDSLSEDARREIYAHSDLIGAVRLPGGAHRRTAGTDVVTDVLLFRKRKAGEAPGDDSWLTSHLATHADGSPILGVGRKDTGPRQLPVNDYFTKNPQNVLGEFVDGGYNGIAVRGDAVTAGTDLRKALARIVKDSGRKFDVDAAATVPAKRNSGSTRDGRIEFTGMVDVPGAKGKNKQVARFTQLVNGIEEEVQVPQTQAAEMRDLLSLRDKLRTLQGREQEILQGDDEVAANMRRDLNSAYEDYVGKYGPITRATTTVTPAKFDEAGDIVTPEKIRKKRPEVMYKFEDDESAAEIFALEKSYSSETNTAQKSDLFESRQSSLGRVVLNETDDPREAVAIAAEMAGAVDLDSVARVLKVDKAEARERIRGLAFNDPSNGDKLTPRVEYLSGNVRKKLEAAKAAAASDPAYEENVRELEAVLPAEATIGDLPLTLGAEWMGPDVIEKFAKHLMGRSNGVEVNLKRSRWSVQTPKESYGRNAILENQTWGTSRRSFYSLLESVLKQQHHSIKVTSKDDDGNVYVDTKASEEATAKAAEIAAEFGDFVWGDAAVAKTLAERYTEKFRAIVLPDYSGSKQRAYPGMTDKLELRAHQNDAVTRAVSSESVLFEHVVGSGKTYTMAATVMELRRTGQVRKPVMSVPSHMLDQWTREFKELYPDAKVLAADSSMLSSSDPKARKKFLARAANNDWDVVIMTREAFESVPVSREALESYLAKELAKMRVDLERARAGGDRKSVKAMETGIAAEEKRIRAALEARKDDHGLNWEAVGFDYVMADEAHDYKNLPFRTTMQGITSPEGADRARDMHMKVEVVRANASKDGSGRVVAFATGTPISNSLAEMYTMTRFLRPDLLEEAGVDGFDSWAATFAAVSSKVEMTTDGSGFKDVVRMRGFSDALGDGLRIWRSFSDVVGKKDVNLRVPSVKTGGRQIHVVPRTEAQDDAMASFRERVMMMRPGKPKKGDDAHVAIIGDGRRAALDPRLMSARGRNHSNISQDDVFESPKFDRAADQIVNIWAAHKDDEFALAYGAEEISPNRGGLQMVMLDSSAPNGGLNGYDMLKERLVERGMDPKRIAYIQDAEKPEDKAELFRKAKQGEIDVIFGSSAALGTGTNVQNRLYAMHHIDGSWRPSDIEQREGRIVRQGNQYDEVELHVYATEATHDSKTWDMVAYKQAGLDAIASGTVDMKGVVFEDDVDPLLDYDLITGQASGNPLVIDRREVEGELKRLSTAARSHQRQIANARSSQQLAQIKRDGAQRDLRALELAQARVTDTSGENFSIEFGTYTGPDRTLTDRNEAADDLGAALKTMLDGHVPRDDGYLTEIGSLGGLSVMARTVNRSGQQPRVELSYGMKLNERRYSTATPVPLESVRVDREQMDSGMRGVIASLESRLRGIDTRKRTVGERVSAADEEYAAAVQNEKRTFRFQGDLDSAQRRKDLLDKILVGDGSTDEKRVELVDANQEYAGLKAEASKSGRRPATPSAGTVVEAPAPAPTTASAVVQAAREPRRVAPRTNEPAEVLDAAEVARDAEDLGIALPTTPRTPRTPREEAPTVEGPADEALDPAEVADDMRELGLAVPEAPEVPVVPATPREAVTRTPDAPNVADEPAMPVPSQVASEARDLGVNLPDVTPAVTPVVTERGHTMSEDLSSRFRALEHHRVNGANYDRGISDALRDALMSHDEEGVANFVAMAERIAASRGTQRPAPARNVTPEVTAARQKRAAERAAKDAAEREELASLVGPADGEQEYSDETLDTVEAARNEGLGVEQIAGRSGLGLSETFAAIEHARQRAARRPTERDDRSDEISESVTLDADEVTNDAADLGINLPAPRAVTPENAAATATAAELNDSDLDRIEQLRAEGVSLSEIGTRLGNLTPTEVIAGANRAAQRRQSAAPTADTTPELQAERDAYRRGFQASKRSTTADLDGAESRFLERYGRENIDSFNRGWTDHAIDAPYSPPVAKDRPTQAPDSVAVPREDLADDAAELGINLPEAPAPASVSTPNGESPWPVFEKFPGLFSEPNAQGMRSIVDAEFDKLDLTTLSDEEIRQLDAQWPGRQQVLPDTRNGALLFAEKRRRRDVAAEARQVEDAAAEVARIERENNGSAYRDESLSVMNRARLQRHLDSLVQAPDGRAITHRELYSQGVGTSSTTNRDGRSTYYLDLEDGASYKVPKLVHDTFVPASRRDSDDEDEALSPEDEAAVESLFTPGPTTALVDVEPSTPTAPDPVDVTPTADDLDETLPDLPEAGDVVPGLSFANGPDRLVLDGQTFDNREAIKAAGFLFGFIPGERARNGAGRRGWVVTGSAQDRRDAVERLRAALSVGGDLPERGEKLPGENFPPTDEQQDVIDSVLAGKDTVVRALAGTGKTTTLEAIARRLQIASPNKRALYVAFNKSIQVEAEGRMPSNVESRTANSLAYGAMPDWMTKRNTGRFDMQAKTGSGAVRRNDDIARHFGITSAIEHDGVTLQPDELAAHARRALGKYVISADDKLGTQHVDGASQHSAEVLDLAGKMWADLQSSDGKVWLDQDHMVKMWALNKPNLQLRNSGVRTSADMIFFDEAQDINPVLAKVIADQKVQKVYVGDGNQAIYGFRGAVDQLDKIDVESDLPLTQSWRFGPEIADAGNRFLDVLGSDSRVIGGGPAGAIVKDMVAPDAVLTRSNGGMIEHAITAQADGRIVGVPAGTRADLRSLVESARWLKARQEVADAEQGRRDGYDVEVPATPRAPQRIHDDLAIFSRWGEVNEAAERGDDPKVRMLARIVDGTGLENLDRMVEQLQEADRGGKYAVEPDVVITTAHKAKGMEWDRVKIADDFTGPKVDPETGDVSYPSPEELRLAYVAVTRAQKELDAGSLGWVYDSGLYPKRDANAPGSADRDADLEIVDRADLPTVEGQAPLPAAPEVPETIPARAAEGQMDGQDKWAIDPGFDPSTFMVQEDAPEARIDETRQIDGQGDILDALDTPEVAAPATIVPAVNGREIQRPAQFDGVTLGELETPEAAVARLQEVDAAAKSPAARENYINALAELQNGIAPELSLEPDGNNRWRAQVDDWNVSLRKNGAQYFYSVTDADGQTIIAEGDVGYDPAQGSAAKNLEAASGLASRSILHRQEMLRSIRVNQADDALVGALPAPMSNGGILDGSKVRQDVDGYSVNDQMRRDINQLPDRLAIPGLRDKLQTLTKGAGKARLRLTRDGEVIADGVHMNADGQLRDGDGNPLPRRAADADVEIVSGYVDLNGPHTPVGSIQPGTVVVGATFREADEPGMFDSRARGRFLGIDSDGHGRLVTEDGKERVLTGGAAPIVRYAAPDADPNAPLDLGRRWWENPLPSEGDTNPWAPLPAGTRPEPAGAYFDKKKKTWSIQYVRETNRPDGGVALSSDEHRAMTTQVHVIPQGDKWLAIPVGRPADRAREFDTRSEALQWGKGETKNPDSALPGGRHLEEGDLPESYRSTAAAPTVEAERVPDADAPNVDAPDTDAPPVVRDVADTDGQSAPDVPPADTTLDVPEADRDRVDLIPGAVAPEGESPSQRRDRQEKREASLTKEVADARTREGRDAPTADERERRNSGGRTNAPNGNGGNGGGGNRPDGGGMNGPGGLDGLSLPDGPSGPSPAAAPLAAALLSDDEPTTNFHNPARVRELDNAALEAALYRAAIEDDQVAADVLASEMDRRYSPTPEAIEDDVASLTSVEKAHIDAEVSQALDADDDAIDAAIQEALRKAQMGAPTRMTDKELIEASRRENASIIEAFFDRDANAGVDDKFSRIVDIGVLDRLNGRQRSALYSGNGVFGAVLAKHLPEELTLAVWDRTPDEMRKNNEVFRWPGTRSSREFIADAELAFREELHAFDTRLAGIAARPATPGQVLRDRREALSNDSGDGLAMLPTRALLPGDVIDTPESGPREVLGVDRVPDGIRVTVRAGDRAEVLTLEADGVTPVNASTARTLTTPEGIGARSTGAVQVDHHGRVLPNGNPAAVAPDTADGYSHDLLSGLDGTTVKAVAGDVTLAGLLEERDGSFLIGGEYIVPSDLRDMTLLTGARELPGPERALSDLPDNSAVRVRTPDGAKDGITFLGLSDDPNMVHFIPSDGSPSVDLPKDTVVGTVAHYQSPIEANRTVPGMWRASEHGTFASTAGIWNASVTPDKDGKHRWSVKGNDSAGDSSLNDEGVADTLEQAQEAVTDSLRSWERDGNDAGRMPFTAPKRADRLAGAPDYDPDGIDGHAAQWTPVNDIPIGAPVRMLGVDHNGDEVTLSGVSLSWPQKVKVQLRGEPEPTLMLAVVVGEKDGTNRRSVFTRLDSLAATADAPALTDANQLLDSAELDAMSGRLGDYVPVDQNGRGIFPGNLVQEVSTGREGIVLDSRNLDVAVRWNDGREGDMGAVGLTNTSTNFRPEGWTDGGRRVTPGDTAILGDGREGTVADAVGDVVTVKTPEGDYVDAPINEATISAPTGARKVDNGKPRLAIEEITPAGTTLLAPLQEEAVDIRLDADNLALLRDLGFEGDALSDETVVAAAIRARTGAGLSRTQADTLADAVAHSVVGDTDTDRVARARRLEENLRNTAAPESRDIVDPQPADRTAEVNDAALAEFIDERPRTASDTVGEHAANATTLATTLHELRQVVAEALASEELDASLERVARRFYDDADTIGLEGPERERVLDEARVAAERAKERALAAVLATINDAERRTGESFEETRDRIARDILTASRQAGNGATAPRTLAPSVPTPRPVTPDTPVAPVQSELPGLAPVPDELLEEVLFHLPGGSDLTLSQREAARQRLMEVGDDHARRAIQELLDQVPEGDLTPKMVERLIAQTTKALENDAAATARALEAASLDLPNRPTRQRGNYTRGGVKVPNYPSAYDRTMFRLGAWLGEVALRAIRAVVRAIQKLIAKLREKNEEPRLPRQRRRRPDRRPRRSLNSRKRGASKPGTAVVIEEEDPNLWGADLIRMAKEDAEAALKAESVTPRSIPAGSRPSAKAPTDGFGNRGELPENLDVAADGGPGSVALAHLESVIQSGSGVNPAGNGLHTKAWDAHLRSQEVSAAWRQALVADSPDLDRRQADHWEAQREAQLEAVAAANLARRDLEALREIREMGETPESRIVFTGDPEAVKSARWAMQHYPTDWIAKVSESGPIHVAVDDERGSYADRTLRVTAENDPKLVVDGAGPYGAVAIHEAAHMFEAVIPELGVAQWTYHNQRTSTGEVGSRKRTGRNATSLLGSQFPGEGYDDDEVARIDNYPLPYMGREYSDTDLTHFELMSVLMESLFGGAAVVEPEMRQFALGVLADLGKDAF